MRWKYLNFITANNDTISFGRDGQQDDQLVKYQIVSLSGMSKNSTKIFKNETINSQIGLFRGNRLSERQLNLRVAIQTLRERSHAIPNKADKELALVDLISKLQTTSIQDGKATGKIVLESINGQKYELRNAITESIQEASTSRAFNNYTEVDITFRIFNPYIVIATESGNSKTFDLSSSTVLTDFVDESAYDASLEFKLEMGIGGEDGTRMTTDPTDVVEVRDGYISNDGIFYHVESYGEDIETVKDGQFWLTDSLGDEVNNKGARTYPTFTINGYVVNPVIFNNTTGQKFQLNMTINSGEYVVVDMENKTAILHQGVDQTSDVRNFISLDSEWMYLDSGNNDIEVSFSSANNEEFSINMNWEILLEGVIL